MSTVTDHYRKLLSEHYVWMFGVPFEEKVAEQKALLERVLGALHPPVPRGPALDLGSGPGFQSIALAELGFSPVIAIDTSAELLTETPGRERLPCHRGQSCGYQLSQIPEPSLRSNHRRLHGRYPHASLLA